MLPAEVGGAPPEGAEVMKGGGAGSGEDLAQAAVDAAPELAASNRARRRGT